MHSNMDLKILFYSRYVKQVTYSTKKKSITTFEYVTKRFSLRINNTNNNNKRKSKLNEIYNPCEQIFFLIAGELDTYE